jgi:hypothetical protein
MEVIGYSLPLTLADHDTIKDCVNIYCEWLSALLPDPKTCVPSPIVFAYDLLSVHLKNQKKSSRKHLHLRSYSYKIHFASQFQDAFG